MDLRLYARVFARFKLLLLTGLVLGFCLAFLSVARVSAKGIEYRQSEEWLSYARLFVTQQGFPWGRLGVEAAPTTLTTPSSPQVADPGRLTSIAIIYSNLADSDPVRRLMLKGGPLHGKVQAAPVLDPQNNEPLPLISIAAFSDTPAHAVELAQRQTSALVEYIRRQQIVNGIPTSDRVSLVVVKKPGTGTDPRLAKGRPMTLALVSVLTVMVGFCGLAFVLENLRPRAGAVAGSDLVEHPTREAA
jgi:hypothetical protein